MFVRNLKLETRSKKAISIPEAIKNGRTKLITR